MKNPFAFLLTACGDAAQALELWSRRNFASRMLAEAEVYVRGGNPLLDHQRWELARILADVIPPWGWRAALQMKHSRLVTPFQVSAYARNMPPEAAALLYRFADLLTMSWNLDLAATNRPRSAACRCGEDADLGAAPIPASEPTLPIDPSVMFRGH